MTESEILYELLHAIKSNRHPAVRDVDHKLIREARRKIAAYRLIEKLPSNGDFMDSIDILTENGYAVIEAGGFNEWVAKTEQRENEAHQAVLTTAKATVDAATYSKHSRNAAWIAAVLTLVALIMSGYQVWNSDQQDKKISAQNVMINAMSAQTNKIESLLQLHSKSQTAKEISQQTQKAK